MSEPTYTPTTWVNNTAPAISADNLNHIEAGIAANAAAFSGYAPLSGTGFKVTDPSDGSTEWNFYRASGATAFTVNGKTGYPAIISLFAPNGTDYADFTFDGSNTEIDSSVGNISLRPLTGGNVNIWATSGTPKLRVGSTNMAQSLDLSHDGTNGIASTTTGDLDLSPASGLVNLTNVSAYTSATAGAASALPATPQGYLAMKVQGTSVKVPYYLP